ncbi:hypothetical protein VCHENC02_3311A, partial [Vibrio harveyi]
MAVYILCPLGDL